MQGVPSQFLPPPSQQQPQAGGYNGNTNNSGVYVPSQFQQQPQQQQASTSYQPLGNNNAPVATATPYNPSYVPPQPQQQQAYPSAPLAYPSTGTNNANGYPNTNTATVAVASSNTMTHCDPELEQALTGTSKFIIQQDMEYLEMAAQAVANAANLAALGAVGEQANSYNIFTDNGGKQFRVQETSNYFCRCCLRPNHELKLHVYNVHNNYNHTSQALLLMDRPWKCGHCCSCANICQQEIKVYKGMYHLRRVWFITQVFYKDQDDGKLTIFVFIFYSKMRFLTGDALMSKTGHDVPDPSQMIGYIKEPFLGGLLSPRLNVMDREGGQEIATIQAEAKCCIGGMCCNHTFHIRDPQSGRSLGKIVKERPGTLSQIAKELTSDADNFTLHVHPDLPVAQKANFLAALHLVDYMFFEDEGDLAVDFQSQSCNYKCCDWYFCGAVVPCRIRCQSCCGKKKKEKQEDSNGHTTGTQQQQNGGYTQAQNSYGNNNNMPHDYNRQHDHHHDHHHGHHHDHHHHPPHHGPGRHHHHGRGPGGRHHHGPGRGPY